MTGLAVSQACKDTATSGLATANLKLLLNAWSVYQLALAVQLPTPVWLSPAANSTILLQQHHCCKFCLRRTQMHCDTSTFTVLDLQAKVWQLSQK